MSTFPLMVICLAYRALFIRIVLATLPLCALLADRAPAQVLEDVEVARSQLFYDGIDSLAAERYEQAIVLLGSLIGAAPAYVDATHGSARYWQGEAFLKAGRIDEAHRVWSAGIGSLDNVGKIDVRLLDAYVTSVFQHRRKSEYSRAVDAYLRILGRATKHANIDEECIIIKHVAQTLSVLPASLKPRVVDKFHDVRCEKWQLNGSAGSVLSAWWRSSDPILSTERNERIEIHLERVVDVQAHFRDDRRVRGFDDRGVIYTRFGPPARMRAFGHSDNPLMHRADVANAADDWADIESGTGGATAFGSGNPLVVLPAGLPKGELWLYDHIDEAGYYFFVKEGQRFRLGQVTDMIPLQLRNFHSQFRGARNAGMLLNMLFGDRLQPGIYVQLAPVHPDFAARLSAYELSKELAQAPGALVGPGTIWAELRAAEDAAIYERDRRMPDSYSDVPLGAHPLHVHSRSARFLDDDGTTRTEIYWQIASTDPLKTRGSRRTHRSASSDDSLIFVTTVQSGADYQRRHSDVSAYKVTRAAELPVQSTVVRGDTGLYNIGLEWAQPFTDAYEQQSEEVRGTRHATLMLDSLEALSNDEYSLEMSDLVPVSMDLRTTSTEPENPRAGIHPYPFREITRDDTIGLYFELYHLTYGSDDLTRYAIEYEVVRRTSRGIFGLLSSREETTSARVQHTAESTTVRTAIALDLSTWSDGVLAVTVRLTDEVNNQTTARDLVFELKR